MKKKILTFLCFIFMTFGMFTGCSGFVMDDESLYISNITSQVLEDGTTMVTIIYTDDEIEPVVFYIPKGQTGETGEAGNGIKEISYEVNETTGYLEVTITFTDPAMEPVTYILKNGNSIKEVEQIVDEETGEVSFILHFTDGTSSDPISVPKGKDGKDGSMIIGYEQTINDDGSVTLMFLFSTGELYTCEIPAPQKGEDGRGIAAIVGTEDEQYYYLTITYTDDTTETIQFNKPVPNSWSSGYEGRPADSYGRNGDYFFDLANNDIYHKINGKWELIVDLESNSDKETWNVTFNLNGEGAKLVSGHNYKLSYEIKKGSNFACDKVSVPIAEREGYTFGGWYTTSTTPTIVQGSFTDLTTVNSDLELYAYWIQL